MRRRPLLALALGVSLVGGGLLLVGLAVVPLLFKDRVVAAALAEANRQVDATITVDAADLTLLSSFPSPELALDGVRVTGKGAFEGVELANVGRLRVSLDLMSVLRGERMRINALELANTRVHVIVDENGRSNTDLAGGSSAPAASGESSSFALDLDDYDVTNLDVVYEDRRDNRTVTVDGLASSGTVRLDGDHSHVTTHTKMDALTVHDTGVDLLQKVGVKADLDVDVNSATGTITLGDNTLSLNALPVAFRGTVTPRGAATDLDLTFAAKDTSFKSLLSLVPAVWTRDYANVVSAGMLAVSGSVKGTYAGSTLPAFDLGIQVRGGAFSYPSLPTSVTDVNVDAAVRHAQGPADLTEIDLKSFSFTGGGGAMRGSLALRHPMTDPDVALQLVGGLDLATLRSALPVGGAAWQGRVSTNVEVAGRVSQFTNGDYDHVRAQGTFVLENFLWQDPSEPNPITVDRLSVSLDPRRADMTDLRMHFGNSDLAGTGSVDDFVAYALSDATLVGRMTMTSNFLDLDALSGGDDDSTKGKKSEKSSIVVVPTNLDLALDATAARVRYDGKDLQNARGSLTVRKGTITIRDMRFDLYGGTAGVSGTYAAPTEDHADVDMSVDLSNFDLSKTVDGFSTVEALVPVAKGAQGRVGSRFGVKTRLNRDLTPNLPSLFSNGHVRTTAVALRPAFLSTVAKKLGNEGFGTLDLTDTDVGFAIQSGRIGLAPMAVRVGGAAATLSGSAGALDKTLDLTLGMNVPVGQIKGELASKLGSVAPGGTVPVNVKVGGTWDKPTVSLDTGSVLQAAGAAAIEAGKDQIDAVADDAIAQAKAQGDQLVAAAQAQADMLKTEAKAQGDKLRAEAKRQGDKLVADAKGNSLQLAAAKEARKKLVGEADKAADKLAKEADRKGDQLVSAAKSQRDKLITEAQSRAHVK